jgi:hypothetical protein
MFEDTDKEFRSSGVRGVAGVQNRKLVALTAESASQPIGSKCGAG